MLISFLMGHNLRFMMFGGRRPRGVRPSGNHYAGKAMLKKGNPLSQNWETIVIPLRLPHEDGKMIPRL